MSGLASRSLPLPGPAKLYLEGARVSGRDYTRVKAGPFLDKTAAEAFCEAYRSGSGDGAKGQCLILQAR